MSYLKEFRDFAMRGNVVDMAVGVIIGSSFGKIVSSVVNDVLMPPIGLLVGGVDFSKLGFTLKEATGQSQEVVVRYGVSVNSMIDFLIVAFCMFAIIQGMNKLMKRSETPAPVATTKECPECRMAIPVAAKRCGHCTSLIA